MSRRPTRGTRAKLVPMLRAILSGLSISLVGYSVLMRLCPGRKMMNVEPRRYFRGARRCLVGMVYRASTVVNVRIMLVQNQ